MKAVLIQFHKEHQSQIKFMVYAFATLALLPTVTGYLQNSYINQGELIVTIISMCSIYFIARWWKQPKPNIVMCIQYAVGIILYLIPLGIKSHHILPAILCVIGGTIVAFIGHYQRKKSAQLQQVIA